MNQPIPKKIIETHNTQEEKPIYTILFDMHSLMKTNMIDKRMNLKGEIYGMLFQTLLKMKILLDKKDFDYIYAFYDGSNSGELRASILFDYKSNRIGKNYDFSGIESEYYKNIDKFVRRVLENKTKTINPEKMSEDQSFFEQKNKIKVILEELFIRQVEVDKCEGDDLIGYYILNKKPNERVIIVSNDMDLSQLISDENYVCQYVIRLKKFITCNNFKENFSYNQANVVNQKILCGDQSDVIYGVKSLGIKTLHNIMPELLDRKVDFYEIIQRVKELKEKREKENKKPLIVYDNILNQVTDGSHPNGKLFEINEKIINLKKPILTREAIEQMDELMYAPIDPENRNMGNLYKLILEYNIEDLTDSNRFSTFFSTFNKTIEKEKKYYEKWLQENK